MFSLFIFSFVECVSALAKTNQGARADVHSKTHVRFRRCCAVVFVVEESIVLYLCRPLVLSSSSLSSRCFLNNGFTFIYSFTSLIHFSFINFLSVKRLLQLVPFYSSEISTLWPYIFLRNAIIYLLFARESSGFMHEN